MHNQMTLGTYLILYQYSLNMTTSLQAVYEFHVRWTSFEVSIERIRSVIESAKEETGEKRLNQIDEIVFDKFPFNIQKILKSTG